MLSRAYANSQSTIEFLIINSTQSLCHIAVIGDTNV